jgi:hypothetical protein
MGSWNDDDEALDVPRTAPMWIVSLGLASAVVVFNLPMPEDPSTGGMAAAIVVFLACWRFSWPRGVRGRGSFWGCSSSRAG